ncbi:uncharacterized protein YALI1_F36649g [Yarrowia lipolytica]|uniref:Uncharacterized protein n=1 Tax=Yarrowia lipolytica TaxID=4952 RepID=A0A1D8NQE1_YARLL|nr:hypothetical protein YALI1_F36649g [Yarrowia lipolytica]
MTFQLDEASDKPTGQRRSSVISQRFQKYLRVSGVPSGGAEAPTLFLHPPMSLHNVKLESSSTGSSFPADSAKRHHS